MIPRTGVDLDAGRAPAGSLTRRTINQQHAGHRNVIEVTEDDHLAIVGQVPFGVNVPVI